MARPTRAELDLSALRHNAALAQSLASKSKLVAVVKANGYGHGAVDVARALEPQVPALAVACIEEALTLRDAGITAPILLLEGFFTPDEIDLAAEHEFWLMVENDFHLHSLEASTPAKPLRVWLKVDSGMHRLGVAPAQARDFHQRLSACAAVDANITLCTHFACADDVNSTRTTEQLAEFDRACNGLPGPRSAANSPGVIAWPDSHRDWIRPGFMLYGSSPMVHPHPNADSLRPVMTLKSAVIGLRTVPVGETAGYGDTWRAERPSTLATVCIGYGDGYPRTATNGTPVLVKGQRALLAGRVSMDMITVDVTDIPGVALGDEVILWGQGLPLAEVAPHCSTIGYELTTRMPARTPRMVIVG